MFAQSAATKMRHLDPCPQRFDCRFLDAFRRFLDAAQSRKMVAPSQQGDDDENDDPKGHNKQDDASPVPVRPRCKRNDPDETEGEGAYKGCQQ